MGGTRVRFAPAPGSSLHVGGARTALFNWLYAKRADGSFLLRIDDTFPDRSHDDEASAILDDLEWLGITWDEGPTRQSEGIDRHARSIELLLSSGAAYRDFGPPPRLVGPGRQHRPERYRNLAPSEAEERARQGEPHWVRLRVDPEGPDIEFEDEVFGLSRAPRSRIEDIALLRADGSATYHLATVVDDLHDAITLVMRGQEHIPSTTRQLLIFEALGERPPRFAHLPALECPAPHSVAGEGNGTSLRAYRDAGVLPSAMRNFLALLGFSPPHERVLFLQDHELIDAFDLDRVSRAAAVLDPARLQELSRLHLEKKPVAELLPLVASALSERGLPDLWEGSSDRDAMSERAVDLARKGAASISEVVDRGRGIFWEALSVEEDLVRSICQAVPMRSILQSIVAAVESCPPQAWPDLRREVDEIASRQGVPPRTVLFVLRVAISGAERGPALHEVLRLLGPDRTLGRLRALERRCGRG